MKSFLFLISLFLNIFLSYFFINDGVEASYKLTHLASDFRTIEELFPRGKTREWLLDRMIATGVSKEIVQEAQSYIQIGDYGLRFEFEKDLLIDIKNYSEYKSE